MPGCSKYGTRSIGKPFVRHGGRDVNLKGKRGGFPLGKGGGRAVGPWGRVGRGEAGRAGRGFSLNAPEAALAALVFADASVEIFFLKIWPEFLQNHDLGITALPK